MGFDVVDVGGLQPRGGQRLAQQRLLGRSGGKGQAAAGPDLVGRRTAHHRQHPIPVTQPRRTGA